MLGYVFIVEGLARSAITPTSPATWPAHGVDARLLPLVILTKLGCICVLFGLKTR